MPASPHKTLWVILVASFLLFLAVAAFVFRADIASFIFGRQPVQRSSTAADTAQTTLIAAGDPAARCTYVVDARGFNVTRVSNGQTQTQRYTYLKTYGSVPLRDVPLPQQDRMFVNGDHIDVYDCQVGEYNPRRTSVGFTVNGTSGDSVKDLVVSNDGTNSYVTVLNKTTAGGTDRLCWYDAARFLWNPGLSACDFVTGKIGDATTLVTGQGQSHFFLTKDVQGRAAALGTFNFRPGHTSLNEFNTQRQLHTPNGNFSQQPAFVSASKIQWRESNERGYVFSFDFACNPRSTKPGGADTCDIKRTRQPS
ncbi:MAG: hypothetical protein U0514_00175 [Candidatus Andersenbacteria bacterium]